MTNLSREYFQNKVAIITGGGRGIGKACAKNFAKHGCHVALISRSQSELEKTQAEINQESPVKCLIFVGDIAKEKIVSDFFQQVKNTFKSFDFLINNAGTFHAAPVLDHSPEEWDRVMAVNVKAPFLCARAFLREMVAEKKQGAIVNISSIAGLRGVQKFKGLASYCASKYGVIGFTECLAIEAAEMGVRVNCVAPGAVNTRMLAEAAPFLKTNTQPEDIAKIILTLCDETQSKALTGSTIEVFTQL